MSSSRERDRSVERLLRQSLQASQEVIGDSCLDAETLAAWIDGGLCGSALVVAQSHVADCVRCQALVGTLARTAAIVPAPEPPRRRWLRVAGAVDGGHGRGCVVVRRSSRRQRAPAAARGRSGARR